MCVCVCGLLYMLDKMIFLPFLVTQFWGGVEGKRVWMGVGMHFFKKKK